MIGLAPAPNPLVHNHVHPPPFFLRGRKTKPCPQPLTPSLTTLHLFIFQMACGTPKIVLAVPATVTGRSALVVGRDGCVNEQLLRVAETHVQELHGENALERDDE